MRWKVSALRQGLPESRRPRRRQYRTRARASRGLGDAPRNTIVIYASDQGWYLGEHGWFDKLLDVRRVASYARSSSRWPGVHRAGGARATRWSSNLDLAETFLDIAGVEIPSDIQGESLAPLLEGENAVRLASELLLPVLRISRPARRRAALRRAHGEPQAHLLLHARQWELYDLEKDPDELTSVSRRSRLCQRPGATSRLSLIGLRGEQYAVPEDAPASRSSVTISRKLHDRDHPTFEKTCGSFCATGRRAACL